MSISGPSKIVEQVGITIYEDEITKYNNPYPRWIQNYGIDNGTRLGLALITFFRLVKSVIKIHLSSPRSKNRR